MRPQKFFVVLMLGCMVVPALAASSRKEYELQEKCGKRAQEWFKGEWGEGFVNGLPGMARYRNHYSGVNNKCFVLLIYETYSEKIKRATAQHTLFDVDEGKTYGSMLKFTDTAVANVCSVNLQRCKTEAEWEALIAPYMGD